MCEFRRGAANGRNPRPAARVNIEKFGFARTVLLASRAWFLLKAFSVFGSWKACKILWTYQNRLIVRDPVEVEFNYVRFLFLREIG